jgi:hypothetical protein
MTTEYKLQRLKDYMALCIQIRAANYASAQDTFYFFNNHNILLESSHVDVPSFEDYLMFEI